MSLCPPFRRPLPENLRGPKQEQPTDLALKQSTIRRNRTKQRNSSGQLEARLHASLTLVMTNGSKGWRTMTGDRLHNLLLKLSWPD